MQDLTAPLVRQSHFLLKNLFSEDEKKLEHQRVYREFRKLLAQLKSHMENTSHLMSHKQRKLGNFVTHLRLWGNKNPKAIESEIAALNIKPQSEFLLYKTWDDWYIYGRTITGEIIDHKIDRISEHQSHLRDQLLAALALKDRKNDETLETNDPLHRLVVEYFGYYRPSIFISYSWPSDDYPDTKKQDTINKRNIHKIAKDLEIAGFRVLIDKDDLTRGDNINHFIDLIDSEDTDYICVMGTPLYQLKYKEPALFLGGESNKTHVEAKAIVQLANSRPEFNKRVVPLLIDGHESKSFPAQLKDKIFCKFSENDYFNTFLSLIFTLYKFKKDKHMKRIIEEFNLKVRPTKDDEAKHPSTAPHSPTFFSRAPHPDARRPLPPIEGDAPPSTEPPAQQQPIQNQYNATIYGGIHFGNSGNVTIGNQTTHIHHH